MVLVHCLWLCGAVPVALNCFLWPRDAVLSGVVFLAEQYCSCEVLCVCMCVLCFVGVLVKPRNCI